MNKEDQEVMVSEEIARSEHNVLPLSGKKVYSPIALAAYTFLGNVLIGCILYGLNLRARGAKAIGLFSMLFGIVGSSVLLTFVVVFDCELPKIMTGINLIAGLSVYQIEKFPFRNALQCGATRSRWWLPALFILGIIGVLVAATYLIDILTA